MATRKTRYPEDDITLLLPTMQTKVLALLERMTALGFQPVLFDGLRTVAEAMRNAKRGTGIVASIHNYGAAADVICDEHGWSCASKRCKFYTALGREAKALGFVWGDDFTTVRDGKRVPKPDMPHVQGVTIAQQDALRRLGRGPASAGARDALVAAHFAGR